MIEADYRYMFANNFSLSCESTHAYVFLNSSDESCFSEIAVRNTLFFILFYFFYFFSCGKSISDTVSSMQQTVSNYICNCLS